jgi:predicted NUDIX family NTP pyrophosphohydrolase
MKRQSAGLLVYRTRDRRLEVLIAHMGGPWFKNKDKGAWSIPKGEYSEDEDPKETAKREFKEELSLDPPKAEWHNLGTVEQKNNKRVVAWAVEGDMDVSNIKSNLTKGEWPPRSGKIIEWPEIDKAAWFTPSEAAKRLVTAQVEFLQRLAEKLGVDFDSNKTAEEHKPKQNSLF